MAARCWFRAEFLRADGFCGASVEGGRAVPASPRARALRCARALARHDSRIVNPLRVTIRRCAQPASIPVSERTVGRGWLSQLWAVSWPTHLLSRGIAFLRLYSTRDSEQSTGVCRNLLKRSERAERAYAKCLTIFAFTAWSCFGNIQDVNLKSWHCLKEHQGLIYNQASLRTNIAFIYRGINGCRAIWIAETVLVVEQ